MAPRSYALVALTLLCHFTSGNAGGPAAAVTHAQQQLLVKQSLNTLVNHASLVSRKVQTQLATAVPDARAAVQMARRLTTKWDPLSRKLTDSEDPVCEWDEDMEDCKMGSSFLDSLAIPTALRNSYDTLVLDVRCRRFKTQTSCTEYESGKCVWHGPMGDPAACRVGGGAVHHLYTMMVIFDSSDCSAWGIYLNSVVPCMQVHSGQAECEAADAVCKWLPPGHHENLEAVCPANATQCSDCNATSRCLMDRSQFQRAFCPTLSLSMEEMTSGCMPAPIEPDMRMAWLSDCYKPHCGALAQFIDLLAPVLTHCLQQKNPEACDEDPLCIWAAEPDGTAFCNYSPDGMLSSIPASCPYSNLVKKEQTCTSLNASVCGSHTGCVWDTTLDCGGSKEGPALGPSCSLGVSGALEAVNSQRDPTKEKLFELMDGISAKCMAVTESVTKDNETCSEAVPDEDTADLHRLVLKKIDQIKDHEAKHEAQLNGPTTVLTTSAAPRIVPVLTSGLLIMKAIVGFL